MPIVTSVLVVDGSRPRGGLVQRLRKMGFRTLRAKAPEQAFALVEESRHRVGVALIPPDLPVSDLGAALEALTDRSPLGSLPFIVLGHHPESETLTALRCAGVELALWEPFSEGRLRFQVNRALAEHAGPRRRDDLRAPIDRATRVIHGGREKPVRLYTLSATGAFLETPRPSQRNAALELELPIGPAPLRVAARVVFTNVPGNLQRENLALGMGVRFESLDERILAEIRREVAAISLELSV